MLASYLLEGAADLGQTHLYGRAERVDKELTPADLAPGGGFETVTALTLGAVQDVWTSRLGALGIGADATLNVVPPQLQASYGGAYEPAFEVYVRLAPPLMAAMRM